MRNNEIKVRVRMGISPSDIPSLGSLEEISDDSFCKEKYEKMMDEDDEVNKIDVMVMQPNSSPKREFMNK